jgi:lantibiotic modifying enzyme
MTGGDGIARAARWRTAALGIARELTDDAVWADGMCAFHGATPPESLTDRPRYRSMGADLYEGSAGIARFLAAAASVSRDAVLKRTALGAMRHALEASEGWSLFTGATGVGLAALEVAERLENPDLVLDGTRLIERGSVAATNEGRPCDLLVGTAGVVVALCAAHRYDVDGGWTARAFDLGRGLLAAAIAEGPDCTDGPPLSWPLAPDSPVRLCGLAHGASGVALALEALAHLAPGESGWPAAARRARNYERAYYAADEGSWADLRPTAAGVIGGPPGYPHMWCHGSIGIAAERLGAVDHDLLARADAVAGLAGARAHAMRLAAGPAGAGAGDALNGSLCHGLAGLIDLFIDAWQVTGDSSWMAVAGGVGDLILNDSRRHGRWRSGVPGGWPAPGLMLGRAGTGWALLRLAEPDRVPSGWRVGPVPG